MPGAGTRGGQRPQARCLSFIQEEFMKPLPGAKQHCGPWGSTGNGTDPVSASGG